jgi:mRNA deadenylase 3'-5' endonuclease subunit Ccr4
VSYNMLAQSLVRRDLFTYCSKSSLKVAFRKENLLGELSHLRADIICMQEVDRSLMDTWWVPRLGAMGYKAEWAGQSHHIAASCEGARTASLSSC